MPLNLAQKKAVEFVYGPCLILAGAGSGKTKVIIQKIIYLIKNCGYQAHHIVAVTFTNKAAHEIKVRLSQKLDAYIIKRITVSTFHSLGLEIIKKEIHLLNLNTNFLLFNEKDRILLLKKIIMNEDKKIDTFLLKKLIFMLSYWKNKFITPIEVEKLSVSRLEKKLAIFYKEYDFYLRQFHALDFDDLICIPVALLKKNKEAHDRWNKKITYLLVDEYQDTNNSQYELLKILVSTYTNFTLVGDDDQSIYSWRGAQPKNILLLKNDFPNLKIIKMEHNYRSSGRILKAANSLISYNVNYFQKKLFSQLQYGKKIEIIIGKNEEQEAKKITKKILYYKKIHNILYKNCAILYRTNYQSRIFEKMFIKYNIPYYISGNLSFFARSEIQDILAYLRIIINPSDNYAFIRIINIPSRHIGVVTIKKLENFAHTTSESLFNASKNSNLKNIFTEKTIKKIHAFIIWIEKMILESISQPLNLLYKIIKDIKYEDWLLKIMKNPVDVQASMKNIYILFDWFKNMLEGDTIENPMNLSTIVEKMTLNEIIEKDISKKENNKIQLMTLHASKGLEFSLVFIIGMIEGILPNYRSINEESIQEERRLAYVGITRAKEKLYCTFSMTRNEYGKIIETEPSRFLFELPLDDLYLEDNKKLYNLFNSIDQKKSRILSLKKLLQNFKN